MDTAIWRTDLSGRCTEDPPHMLRTQVTTMKRWTMMGPVLIPLRRKSH
jgi:hypothetical protein